MTLDRDRAGLERVSGFVSREEIDRANRFRFQEDRDRFVVARGSLRLIVGGCLDVCPGELRFRVNEFGKPFLESRSEPLRFNLAHSRNVAVIAVSNGREVGIDIEYVDLALDVLRVAGKVFSDAEVDELKCMEGEERTRTFFRGWTRREARVKAVGNGFSSASEEIPVSMLAVNEKIAFKTWNDERPRTWSIVSIGGCGDEWASAIALEGDIEEVVTFENPGEVISVQALVKVS